MIETNIIECPSHKVTDGRRWIKKVYVLNMSLGRCDYTRDAMNLINKLKEAYSKIPVLYIKTASVDMGDDGYSMYYYRPHTQKEIDKILAEEKIEEDKKIYQANIGHIAWLIEQFHKHEKQFKETKLEDHKEIKKLLLKSGLIN